MTTVNPWKQFLNLLPGGSRTVVTVTANNGDGTSTVQLRDSTTMRVQGEGVEPPNRALVVDGELRQQVPALDDYSAEV